MSFFQFINFNAYEATNCLFLQANLDIHVRKSNRYKQTLRQAIGFR